MVQLLSMNDRKCRNVDTILTQKFENALYVMPELKNLAEITWISSLAIQP